jgi:hypothetical protein
MPADNVCGKVKAKQTKKKGKAKRGKALSLALSLSSQEPGHDVLNVAHVSCHTASTKSHPPLSYKYSGFDGVPVKQARV